MSSRNLRLSEEQRQRRPKYTGAYFSVPILSERKHPETIDFVTNRINQIDGLRVEYFDIVNGATLQPVSIGTSLLIL